MAATKAALSATSVLPKPTSPHTSRSIGLPEPRSSSTAPMLEAWSSVSPYGKRATNSSNAPSGGAMAGACRSCLSAPLDEIGGDLANALLEAGLARLPGDAAETVELHRPIRRAVAGSSSMFSTAGKLGAFRVGDLQAVVRRSQRGDGGETVEAADAVVGVHHEVADTQAGRLGDDVGSAPRLAPGPHQRSPRMSCSPMTARLGVSKPCSMPRTANADASAGSASTSAKLSTLRELASRCSTSSASRRSRAPCENDATITRLLWACRLRTCWTAAVNTLPPSPDRSSAKLRPTRPPKE